MSTLKVDNLLNAAGNQSPISVPGASKAWVAYDQANNNVLDSFNVGSVIDNSAGDFTVNFTNALSNANYCVAGTIANTNDNFSSIVAATTRGQGGVQIKGTVAPTTTSVTVESYYGAHPSVNAAKSDFSRSYIVLFGD